MARMLRDMVIIITGASAGIGAQLARDLSASDAKLVLTARRMDRLQKLNNELGGLHLCVGADVSIQDDCKKVIDQTIQHFGRIDTLICNAGFGGYDTVDQTTPEQVRAMIATNVLGSTDCIYYAVPYMIKQAIRDGYRGQIILISSVAGRRGVPYLGIYSATKSAQLSIAEAMRAELYDSSISVTSVHPIMTKTEFGMTAESKGSNVLPQSDRDRFTQSVEYVSRRICRAIVRPSREVWPSRVSRWLVMMAAFMPWIGDLALIHYARKVRQANQKKQA